MSCHPYKYGVNLLVKASGGCILHLRTTGVLGAGELGCDFTFLAGGLAVAAEVDASGVFGADMGEEWGLCILPT